jgi:hypothetical protein
VHLPKVLHLKHKLELIELRIVASNPVETLRRPKLLGVQVLEESVEEIVNISQVTCHDRPKCIGAIVIDRPKQKPLDVVVLQISEDRRIQVFTPKAVPRRIALQGGRPGLLA